VLDRIPYAFQCCDDYFCFECIKINSQNEIAKCPSCQEKTNKKISQLKPNQKMMKIMEKLKNSEKKKKKEKVVCIYHEEKVVFHQESLNLIGCHKCQYGIQGLVLSECKQLDSQMIYQDLKNLGEDFKTIIQKNQKTLDYI
jgi:hypothetical protein